MCREGKEGQREAKRKDVIGFTLCQSVSTPRRPTWPFSSPSLPSLPPSLSPSEKVCAKKFIVIVDDSKMVPGLGVTGAMPVEITPFCHEHTQRTILGLPGVKGAATGKLRMDGDKPYVTDNDNYIVDLYYTAPIADVMAVAGALEKVVGVVEHGFFLDMTTAVIVAGKTGIDVINKK